MRSADRTLLVKLCVELSLAGRAGGRGWRAATKLPDMLGGMLSAGPIIEWDDDARAYGATWTCGRVEARQVGALADRAA